MSRLFKKRNVTHVQEFKSVDSLMEDDGASPKALARVTGKDATFGMNPAIKTFYEGKNSQRGIMGENFDWVETPPKQLSAKTIKVYDRVAIKVYKIKDLDQATVKGRTPIKIHMIEVQSPHLIAALKSILEPVGVFLEVHEIAKFEAPFRPLYFCYDAIRARHQTCAPDSVLGAHLKLLLAVLGELFDGFRTQLAHLRASGLVNYKLAWTYFARGSTAYVAAEGTERLVRVVDTVYLHGKCKALVVQGEELTFDGDEFAWSPVQAFIPPFEGNLPVTELAAYPFSFHAYPETVSTRLATRGRKVLEYQDLAYRECEGVGIFQEGERSRKHTVSGRVLIDFYGYQKYHKGLERTEDKARNAPDPYNQQVLDPYAQPDPNSNKSQLPQIKKEVYVQRLSAEKQKANRNKVLAKPSDLVYLSPTLLGYSLKGKLWLKFHVNDLRPVQWNDEAYGHLVYPEEQKDLVLSFVQDHRSSAQAAAADGVDDVILGKGRGLVILLSGPPGTGKTLTAEAVADQTRRPLFCVQAEDLGTNAAVLGEQLKKAFAMAADWNAVVLLDEADVFMAVRQPSDVARNELVSIFLRELEYFSGTIFLTTNLLQNIDQAFRSRVDIHLLFNSLPASAREVVWRKFLKRLPPQQASPKALEPAASANGATAGTSPRSANPLLDDAAYAALARWDLNGREIKNAVKTVRTWCLCKGYVMDLARLEAGIRVTAPMAYKLKDGEQSVRHRMDPNELPSESQGWSGEGGWGMGN